MRRLLYLLMVLLACASVRAQVSISFETPPYNGTAAGVILSGQDGWINPVAGTREHLVHTYAGNALGFPTNPTGGQQFIAGRNVGTGSLAVQRNQNFGSADTWTVSWDTAVKFLGQVPATQPIASFSLENASSSRSFMALQTWSSVTAPTTWNAGYQVFNAAGVQVPSPGLFAGPQWQNLQVNRWYRQSTTFSFSTNQIIEVSLTDIVAQTTATVRPVGWFLRGGANPTLPVPTALRFTCGGTSAGNTSGWDNLVLCPFQVSSFSPPQAQENGIIQIFGCGFGNNPDNLSVALMQGSSAAIPLTVLSTTNTQITARLGPVPSGSPPGAIVVTLGQGFRDPLTPTLDDVIPEIPTGTLVWDRLGDPRRASSASQFVPLFSPPQPGTQWFVGQLIAGEMRVTLNGGLQPNTTVRIISKLHSTTPRVGSDVESLGVRLRVGGTPPLGSDVQYFAERVRDVLQSAYSSHAINTTCTIVNTGPTSRQLVLRLLDSSMQVVPINFGVLDVFTQAPILINPFPIGPITAFFNATLAIQSGTAVIGNIGSSGNDGATISPTSPTTSGVRIATELVQLAVPGDSITTRAWGTLGGAPTQLPNQLLGTARVVRTATGLSVTADFSPIPSSQVRVETFYNTAPKGANAVLPNGTVAQISATPFGVPQINGFGGRPQNGPNGPFLWLDFDRPAIITPTGGSPRLANQIRLFAQTPGAIVQNIQAFDVAAGSLGPEDATSVGILSSVEGGICYANCDRSTTPPTLNINDFTCFLNDFAAGRLSANCDGSEVAPVLNVNDFGCFLNSFATGCP